MRGRVLEVSGKLVTIEPERPFQCFGCMQGECGKIAPVKAEKTRNRELSPGQFVETGVSGKTLLTQTLGALLPPATGFTGGYLATTLIFPSLGEASRAAIGLILLFAGAAGFYVFRRHFPPKTLPRIVRIL
jgi:positive regulator of sigma E activity